MSQLATSADVLPGTLPQREGREPAPELTFAEARSSWSPESFAREQARGLVRQLFLCASEKRVRHVLFSAIDRETDITSITWLVAQRLALEKIGSVAVTGCDPPSSCEHNEPMQVEGEARSSETALRQRGLRLRENLWWLPSDPVTNTAGLHASFCELRSQFDYSIIAGPAAGLAMLRMVDGVVLVISARHTRKATALSVKRALQLANTRLLGTVLIDREFPIPANIYRHL